MTTASLYKVLTRAIETIVIVLVIKGKWNIALST